MPETRWDREASTRGDSYRRRFEELHADGADLDGEARLVDALVPRGARILDAGCGAGRVGAALHARGHRVIGIDRDADLIESGRTMYPGVDLRVCDLLDAARLGQQFDLIVLAGNVLVYMAPGTERAGLTVLASVLVPGGRVAAGFATHRHYAVSELDCDASAAGVPVESRFATWHLDPWTDDADWAVTIFASPGDLDCFPVSLTLGIVGLPNVGKSTLFNALTRSNVLAANYPFATIEPNVGVVPLPDPRLDQLATLFKSVKIVPANVSFVDIAGIVKGASEGQGLGNKFLANIREADAICQVVRVFADSDVIHIDGRIDPIADVETVNTELILADLQTLEKALPRIEKEARTDKNRTPVLHAAVAANAVLDSGRTLFSARAELDLPLLRELSLLTAKPFLYVFNADESVLTDDAAVAKLAVAVRPADAVFLDAKVEFELQELDDESAMELLESIGQTEPGLNALARAGFHTLGLQTYLTAGPKESRAWTIKKGATAPQAAGVIHSDFERGFIKAEIVSFTDLTTAGSMAAAKAAGKVRIEGKDYLMADGDVVEFRFNV